jgi:hypothetical protein
MQPERLSVLLAWEQLFVSVMVVLQFLSPLWHDFLLSTVAVLLWIGRTET